MKGYLLSSRFKVKHVMAMPLGNKLIVVEAHRPKWPLRGFLRFLGILEGVCVCVKVSFQGMEGFCSILYYLDPLKLHVKLAWYLYFQEKVFLSLFFLDALTPFDFLKPVYLSIKNLTRHPGLMSVISVCEIVGSQPAWTHGKLNTS